MGGTATTAGQYINTAVVTGTDITKPNEVITDSNPSRYYGVATSIVVTKYTNGYDADLTSDPMAKIAMGNDVTWLYVVTDTGTVPLSNLTLLDDQLGNVLCPVTELAAGETTVCEVSGIATTNGIYTNTATVEGTPTLPPADHQICLSTQHQRFHCRR